LSVMLARLVFGYLTCFSFLRSVLMFIYKSKLRRLPLLKKGAGDLRRNGYLKKFPLPPFFFKEGTNFLFVAGEFVYNNERSA